MQSMEMQIHADSKGKVAVDDISDIIKTFFQDQDQDQNLNFKTNTKTFCDVY